MSKGQQQIARNSSKVGRRIKRKPKWERASKRGNLQKQEYATERYKTSEREGKFT